MVQRAHREGPLTRRSEVRWRTAHSRSGRCAGAAPAASGPPASRRPAVPDAARRYARGCRRPPCPAPPVAPRRRPPRRRRDARIVAAQRVAVRVADGGGINRHMHVQARRLQRAAGGDGLPTVCSMMAGSATYSPDRTARRGCRDARAGARRSPPPARRGAADKAASARRRRWPHEAAGAGTARQRDGGFLEDAHGRSCAKERHCARGPGRCLERPCGHPHARRGPPCAGRPRYRAGELRPCRPPDQRRRHGRTADAARSAPAARRPASPRRPAGGSHAAARAAARRRPWR